MDARRFDNLVKRVAVMSDRRRVLAGVSGFAFASLPLISVREAQAGAVHAEDTRRKCNDKCEDRFCAGWNNDVTRRRCERRCKRECRRHHR